MYILQNKIQYYSPVRMWGHTIFTVLVLFSCSGNKTLIQDSEVQHQRATYNCPWEKTGVHRFKPTFAIDWPWYLLMVIANASQTGNWRCLNLTGMSSVHCKTQDHCLNWWHHNGLAGLDLWLWLWLYPYPLGGPLVCPVELAHWQRIVTSYYIALPELFD